MFHINVAIASLYLLFRFVLPLHLSAAWRVCIGVVLVTASQYHLIQKGVFGTMFSPEMPRWAVIIAGWAFCSFVLLFIFMVLLDVSRGLLALLRVPAARYLGTNKARLSMAMLVAMLGGFGVYQAVQVPDVRHVEISIAELPPALDGLRVVQLTDLHVSRLFHAPWLDEVVARTNALEADVVLISGDLIDGTLEDRGDDVEPFGKLRAAQGVIAIPGNHEYYFNEAQWNAEFERLGIGMLVNQHVVLGSGEQRLVIAGVADEVATRFGRSGPDVDAALKGAPADVPVILLKHRPASAEKSADAGVDIQLSGHTHGGMIKGFDQVVRYANEGFVSGAYQIGKMTLYVSNGTGLWGGFPIRLGIPAEITEITLRTRPAQ